MNDMSRPKAMSRKAIGAPSLEPMAQLSDMLMGQALRLDGMFDELVGYAADNLPQYPLTGERFTRLALRTQSNCCNALVAMAKAHRAMRRAQDDDAE